jgi:DNA repair exonuclease SbcCD ATPase subunit
VITLTRLAAAQYKGIHAIDISFPERGSFLIEGRNEAGKSTLFDAIHFGLYGTPLVGDLADAISYGGDEMAVHLNLRIGATDLQVRRNIRQTAKTQRAEAELQVIRGDDIEVVKGARAVSTRLQQELGGLTSEALHNSCLVAQKQLGRLETLSRASREDALTVLLNLGKLSDIHGRLRVKPEDEAQLRRAQARVDLARLSVSLTALEAKRAQLQRTGWLISLRDTADQLRLRHADLAQTNADAALQAEHLAAVRKELAALQALEDALSRWQHVHDLSARVASARLEVAQSERQAEQARIASSLLPSRRAALSRVQDARAKVQALLDARARLVNLSAEADRIAVRLEERAQLMARRERLSAQLEDLRRQRRDLQTQLMQLAPLTAELQASKNRQQQFQQLAEQLRHLEAQRDALESLEERLAARVEIDGVVEQAGTALLASQRTLVTLEDQRKAVERRHRLEERLDTLKRWVELRRAREAAEQARRLMDDLALAVSGVEHIGIDVLGSGAGADTAGLDLNLVADHPITGALVIRLQLWAGGGKLVEVRPANKVEASGLGAGMLPSLSAADAEAQQGDLVSVEETLAVAGEPVPASIRDAVIRIESLAEQLRSPAPLFDQAAFQQALATVAVDERALASAKGRAAGLAEASMLRRQAASTGNVVASLEKACFEAAIKLKLAGRTAESIEQELPQAMAAEQARSNELSVSAGQRQGIQAQLAILDRNGKERARELEECQQNLGADSEASLEAARQRIDGERVDVQSGAVRLQEAIQAYLRDCSPLRTEEGAPTAGESTSTASPAGLAHSPACETAAGTLPQAAGHLDPAALRDVVQAQVEALNAEVAVLEKQAGQFDEAMARVQSASEAAASSTQDLVSALGAARGQDAGTDDEGLLADLRALSAYCAERVHTLRAELESKDEPALRASEQEAQRVTGALEGHLRRLEEDRCLLVDRAGTAAAALGRSLPELDGASETAGTTVDLILQVFPEVGGMLPSRDEIEGQLRALDQERGGLERGAHDARTMLGDESPIDLVEAEGVHSSLQQDLAMRRRGQEIVALTRQRMINKVLPDTIDNMCLLLPLLTAGRYRHAEVTPDYRLQVWDERKKGFVEKNLFSGGTQDQFSLSLRLGFALAALPRELGTSPGFLFLDEPLSSFDRDRTEALVNLLTHGQIATFFQQVFLISHSQAFDPGLFSHHIVMEEGKVAASTLAGKS